MKLINAIIGFFKISEGDREIIEHDIKNENIRRVFYMAIFGAPLSFLHIILFSLNLEGITRTEYEWRVSILVSHIIITSSLIFTAIAVYFSFIKEKRNNSLPKFCLFLVIFLLMFAGSVISAIDQQVTTAINPYIVSSLATAIVLLIRPLYSVAFYTISFVVFYFLMRGAQPTPDIQISNLVNGLTFTVIGLLISLIFWRLQLTRYQQHRLIKNQKNELEENYYKLKFYSEELKESNNTKDKLMSIIAHDLRSPLASLINVTRLLSEEFDMMSSDEIKNIMVSLNKETELTFESLNNLLFWAKSQQKKIEPVLKPINLAKLVEISFLPVEIHFRQKNIEFINNTNSNIVVNVDASMLQSVFRNLLVNAIKFTHEKGQVTINTELNGNSIVVAVKDSGIGMKPEIVEKLFTSSFEYSTRGTQNEKGTGLGLQICKEFLEANGGQIWADSELGKGSTFYFTLPLPK